VRGFNRGRIGIVAVVGDQKYIRLELALPLDLKRFRRRIALFDRILIGDEGRRIECIGLDVFVPETIGLLQPLVDRDKTVLADEGGSLWQIFDPLESDPW